MGSFRERSSGRSPRKNSTAEVPKRGAQSLVENIGQKAAINGVPTTSSWHHHRLSSLSYRNRRFIKRPLPSPDGGWVFVRCRTRMVAKRGRNLSSTGPTLAARQINSSRTEIPSRRRYSSFFGSREKNLNGLAGARCPPLTGANLVPLGTCQ